MLQRCPKSEYMGIARLNGYRWIINDRGYANVVENKADLAEKRSASNEVWGLVYRLQPDDEAGLDINEGVPVAYTKEDLLVEFWPARDSGKMAPDMQDNPQEVKMLVYVDRKRVRPDKPRKEYIYRMNLGIKDALKEGMPREYVDGVMRMFIPDQEEDEEVAIFARQQALRFEDE